MVSMRDSLVALALEKEDAGLDSTSIRENIRILDEQAKQQSMNPNFLQRTGNFISKLRNIPNMINENFTGTFNPSPTEEDFNFILDKQKRLQELNQAQLRADQQADFNRLGLALSFLQSGQPRTTPGLDFTPISNALANINQNMMRQRALAPQQAFNRLMMPKQLELMDSNIAKNLASNLPSFAVQFDTSSITSDESLANLSGNDFITKIESNAKNVFDKSKSTYQKFGEKLNAVNIEDSMKTYDDEVLAHNFALNSLKALQRPSNQNLTNYNKFKNNFLGATTRSLKDLSETPQPIMSPQERKILSVAKTFTDSPTLPIIIDSIRELDNNNFNKESLQVYNYLEQVNRARNLTNPTQKQAKIREINEKFPNFTPLSSELSQFEVSNVIEQFANKIIGNVQSTGESASLTTLPQEEVINVENDLSQNNVSQENVSKQQEKPKNNYLQTPNMKNYQRQFFDNSNDFSFLLNNDIREKLKNDYIVKNFGTNVNLDDKKNKQVEDYLKEYEAQARSLQTFSGGYEDALQNLEDWFDDIDAIGSATSEQSFSPFAIAENLFSALKDRNLRKRFENYAFKAKSNVFLGNLTGLKQDSPTGSSGLGPVSNVELETLIRTAGELGLDADGNIKNVTAEVLMKNIQNQIDLMENMRKKALNGFSRKYGIPLDEMEFQRAY